MTSNLEGPARRRGVLKSIAHRPTDGDPMVEATECSVIAGRGLTVETRKGGNRQVTLLSAESWADACRDLKAEPPWTSRRANFLIEGVDLASGIGKTISIGSVRIRVHAETKPCDIMERQHAGLTKALVSSCRGGVYGEVLNDGAIRVGDTVTIEATE